MHPASTVPSTSRRGAVARRRAVRAAALPAALLAGLVALTGCGGDGDARVADCRPGLALIPDASDLTRYRPGGRDLTDLVLNARIIAVPATCELKNAKTSVAKVNVAFTLTRGPAAEGRHVVVPYFLGVLKDDQILDEQDYTLAAEFPPNIDRLSLQGEAISLALPLAPGRSAAAYKLYVGFRLSPADLAAGRQSLIR